MYFKLSNNIHKEVPLTLVILILLLLRPTVLHGIEVNGLDGSFSCSFMSILLFLESPSFAKLVYCSV